MAISTSWFMSGRVILVQIDGDITTQDIVDSNTAITNFIRAGEAPVYLIVDTERMGHFPTNINQFKQMISYLSEPNLRSIVVIGHAVNVLARFMASVLLQLARVELKVVNNIDEAIEFLNRLDQKLELSKSVS
jgi:hypothetical protein